MGGHFRATGRPPYDGDASFGAVLGKALNPLATGTGLDLVGLA